MPKIRETEGCIMCGDTKKSTMGFTALDKNGKKIIVKICLSCLAMMARRAEDRMVKGGGM